MKVYCKDKIRNVVVLGHSGSGKTTILEAMLNIAGVTSRQGRVEDGNTISDYDREEIKHKTSISSTLIPLEWQESKINFIDTPGYFDYVGEVKEALRAADLALIVVSAKNGVEVGTEKAWAYAEEAGIPKLIFVNHMDEENADLSRVVDELKEKFGKSIAPLQLPFKDKNKFVGFVNAIKKEGRRFINGHTEPCEVLESMEKDVDHLHDMIEEAVAETCDELLDKFFNDIHFTVDEIEDGIKKGMEEGIVTPVFCGTAVSQIGIRVLMNSIIKFTPNVYDIHCLNKATDLSSKESVDIPLDDNGAFSAFVFKTIADPYAGKLSIIKVMSGVLKTNMLMYNPKHDTIEKAGHILVLRGKEQIEVPELHAGDIGALAKLQVTATSDTLCTKAKPIAYDEIKFPPSMFCMVLMPVGKGDEDKISQAISKILEEDKTLKLEIDHETKETKIYGIGDGQLDTLLSKLSGRYKLEAKLKVPTVAYREMIRIKTSSQGKYKKQSGGHGQYGDVHIEFEPLGNTSSSYVFEEKIFGGSVPKQYFPAVEKGIAESVNEGPLAGYPVVGIKATLIDGSYHPVDSSELAFKMATIFAFKEGFMKAKPTILEPIGKAVIRVPDAYTGDIMSDMNKRRGRVLGMDRDGLSEQITAEVPMAEMFSYATDLRSLTQGRGDYFLTFERYEETPIEIQKKIVEERAERTRNKEQA